MHGHIHLFACGTLDTMPLMTSVVRTVVIMTMLCARRHGRKRQKENKKEFFHTSEFCGKGTTFF